MSRSRSASVIRPACTQSTLRSLSAISSSTDYPHAHLCSVVVVGDLNMLVLTGGCERTEADCAGLLCEQPAAS